MALCGGRRAQSCGNHPRTPSAVHGAGTHPLLAHTSAHCRDHGHGLLYTGQCSGYQVQLALEQGFESKASTRSLVGCIRQYRIHPIPQSFQLLGGLVPLIHLFFKGQLQNNGENFKIAKKNPTTYLSERPLLSCGALLARPGQHGSSLALCQSGRLAPSGHLNREPHSWAPSSSSRSNLSSPSPRLCQKQGCDPSRDRPACDHVDRVLCWGLRTQGRGAFALALPRRLAAEGHL